MPILDSMFKNHFDTRQKTVRAILAILILALLVSTVLSLNEVRKLRFRVRQADYVLLGQLQEISSQLFGTEIPTWDDDTYIEYIVNLSSSLSACRTSLRISLYSDNKGIYDVLYWVEEYMDNLQGFDDALNSDARLNIYNAINYMCQDLHSSDRAGQTAELLEEYGNAFIP